MNRIAHYGYGSKTRISLQLSSQKDVPSCPLSLGSLRTSRPSQIEHVDHTDEQQQEYHRCRLPESAYPPSYPEDIIWPVRGSLYACTGGAAVAVVRPVYPG